MRRADFFYMFKNEYWNEVEGENNKEKTSIQQEIEEIFGSMPIKFITSRVLTEKIIKILEKRLDDFIDKYIEYEGDEEIPRMIKEEFFK